MGIRDYKRFEPGGFEIRWLGSSFRIGITEILLFGLVLRGLILLVFRPWELNFETYELFRYDPQEYHILAKSLLNGTFDSNTLRTPGFPAFIALIYLVFGVKAWVVFLFHIIINIVSVYLVYKISKLYFSEKVSLTAAFLMAIDPLQLISSFNLFSEITFIPCLLGTIYYFLISFKIQSVKNLIVSAIFLGIATYIRPISIYLPVVLAVIILFSRTDSIIVLVKRSTLYISVFLLVLSPWFLRNYILFDKFEFSTTGGYNMLYVYAAAIIYDRDETGISEAIIEVAKRVDERAKGKIQNPFEIERIQAEIATEIIKENLGVFILNHLTGSVNLYYSFSSYRISKMLGSDDHLMNGKFYGTSNLTQLETFLENKSFISLFATFFSAILFTLEYLFALFGIYRLLKKEQYLIIVVLISVIIYQTALVGVLGNNARFKLPIEPFYLILTAFGMQQFFNFRIFRKSIVSQGEKIEQS